MEQIDIFDEEFRVIEPKVASIDTVHKQGLWHQTFACWLINPQKKTIFLQLRGQQNRVGPNTFDASASGHLSSGEQPINGFRELQEELGNHIQITEQTFLGINRNVIIQGSYINREFCHVYMAKTNSDLSDFDLQKGEVSGIFQLNIQDGIDLFSNKKEAVLIEGKVLVGKEYRPQTKTITKQDFCSYHDRVNISGYYLKVMIMAKRFLHNEEPYQI